MCGGIVSSLHHADYFEKVQKCEETHQHFQDDAWNKFLLRKAGEHTTQHKLKTFFEEVDHAKTKTE